MMPGRTAGLLPVAVYGALVFRLLRIVCPIFDDGYGPTPSFYWGRAPTPTASDYMLHRGEYDLLYTVPYVVAAAIITFIGCVAGPLLARRIGNGRATFGQYAGTTLALLIASSFAVDAGTHLKFWEGPLLIAHRELRTHLIWCRVLLAASLLNGIVQALRRAVRGSGPAVVRLFWGRARLP